MPPVDNAIVPIRMVRLTQIYTTGERADVWVNAALIQTMTWSDFEKVTRISILGRDMVLNVTQPAAAIVALIEQAHS